MVMIRYSLNDSSLLLMSASAMLPAMRALNKSPSPASKTTSAGARESMQLRMIACGYCPAAVVE